MTLPTAEEVTNLYLYGQSTRPSDLTSDSLIRPASATSEITVSTQEYMTSGAGRFALGVLFDLVSDFFNAEPSTFQPGMTYTKEDVADILGLTFFGLVLNQQEWGGWYGRFYRACLYLQYDGVQGQ